ncbi:DUF4331 domain-containing protein [Methylibium sp.]|uniref:DUF4331 domain-containing protein n=1 Tax=Methylibium sp. TaxID=2067992 RepID=UPI0017C65E27|nr:DUF4331 domain-containing protein [Methylibium sp.]MBA3588562.1 DUF4331 domain-containing protein [Methylibium sp.]
MQHTILPSRFARAGLAAALLAAGLTGNALASSHREAPSITGTPKVDATDFYMFRSYEADRSGYVTLIANYLPLQDPYGGPNYFKMDPNALYEIHVDNDGDAEEEITFQFRFTNTLKDIKVPALGTEVSIPLTQVGAISAVNDPNSNVRETFTLDVVRGDRRTGDKSSIMNGGSATFDKPVDNIGKKTIADYAAYAAKHVYTVNLPGCSMPAKVFVGQRKDPFAVNLGTIFDLVNAPVGLITDPAQINAAGPGDLDDKNVTTLSLEVHRDCLTTTAGAAADNPAAVIGGWTSASLRQGRLLSGSPKNTALENASLNAGPWTQVSRLGMPLVNEVVIGLKDKDRFNASEPSGDGQFAGYVTNPTLPVLLDAVLSLGGAAPTNAGRVDLQTVFLTGIAGVNQMAKVTASEMLRLNTAIEPVAFASQNRLGIVGNILAAGSDNAGFPNGRRPKDDIVDISLIAVMGGLCMANGDANALGFGAECKPSAVPLGATAFQLHDAVDQAAAAASLSTSFPYLATPIGGAN